MLFLRRAGFGLDLQGCGIRWSHGNGLRHPD